MRYKILLMLLGVLLIMPIVHAKDITFSLDQKEYYFKTGENAIINLKTENTYKETINGLLSYTLTQSVNQGNFHYSSTNTKSTSFSVDPGKKETPLSFGTSDTPLTLDVNLKFSYNDKDESREVILEGIKIVFVSDELQKNNQQNAASASSQKASASSQQADPFSQQEQDMQDLINQMLGNEQQNTQQQTTQQKLQNNQALQDSSSLKQQMQKQFQDQQAMKEEFQRQLSQNPEFQKEHQELLSQGYNLTSGSINPTANNTGTFELNYQKQDGNQASLKGQMSNGELQSMQKDTPENRQKMLEQLEQSKQFQEYQKQLQEQGFQKTNTEFNQELNRTNLQVNYLNKNNETASIQAEIVNQTIQNIKLENNSDKKEKNYLWILPIALLMGILLAYFAYKKFQKKDVPETKTKEHTEKQFDYKAEAAKLLKKAEEQFEQGKHKDAYGTAGQALRLYLSYEHGLRKETTNDEIITHLRKNKKQHKEIKECFDLCSLVEFAKYEANKKDFEKIIRLAKNTMT